MPERPFTLFTVGPVPMFPRTLEVGARQLPYNRTAEFSQRTFRIVSGLKRLLATDGDVMILTASGTGAMESAVGTFFEPQTRVLVVTGGTFGQRWADLARRLNLAVTVLEPQPGEAVDPTRVRELLSAQKFDAMIVTAHETSTGVLHDVKSLGAIAREHGAFFLVDAISTVLADPFEMDAWGVDATVFSSQKALALPPGLGFVAVGARAIERIEESRPPSVYFDLRDYLSNQKRGQAPYTPAVGLMLMLEDRLDQIFETGIEQCQRQCAELANHFRMAIRDLPLRISSNALSNAVTPLECPPELPAQGWVDFLRDREHSLVVNPNGGANASRGFRVGHLGHQTISDLDRLIEAMREYSRSRSDSARHAWSTA